MPEVLWNPEKPMAIEIAEGRISIDHRLVPTLNKESDDNECIEVDRWSADDRVELAEVMIRRWQEFIEKERTK